MSRHTRREDERVEDAPPIGVGVEHQPHPAEVDLELDAGFPVDDADGLLLATTGPEQLGAEALHGALGDDHALSGEQLWTLTTVRPRRRARRGSALGGPRGSPTTRHDRCCDADGPAQSPRPGPRRSAGLPRRRGRGRARRPPARNDGRSCDRPASRSIARSPSPRSQSRSTSFTSNTDTSRNPIAAPQIALRWRRVDRISDRCWWTPGVVHYWRKGGPMLVAELSSRWSHARGGRHRYWRLGGVPPGTDPPAACRT